ncbi:hypothetical protein [Phenylobacterium sp.]|jgi:hypothetical protein|uniref:hypothetical protein n=1 Tax=Phenylobacterium sp. TaxID=1871053 RepID=UPI002F406FE9
MSKRHAPRPPDLFGERQDDRVERVNLIDIALHLHHQTGKAWLLSDDGDVKSAKWLAFSMGQRGEGRDDGVWTMAVWKAKELGWV